MRVKRLIASFGASFENFVSKVENHEAVADCVIADVRAAAAKLRVQINRIQQQLQRMGGERDKLLAEQNRWRQRSLKLADSDEQRSLQCVRQFRLSNDRLQQVEHQLAEYRAMNTRLQKILADVERRLEQLQLRKTALSSRSARASVLADTQRCDDLEAMERVFERWETAVLEDEYREGLFDEQVDSFEQAFLDREELDDLRATFDSFKHAAGDKDGEGRNNDC